MLRRIIYHFRYRFLSYLSQLILYVILTVLFAGSLLITQLSSILDQVLAQNTDLTVSVYSSITSPVGDLYLKKDHLQKEKLFSDSVESYAEQDGIEYYDHSISLTYMPLRPVRWNGAESYAYYSADPNGISDVSDLFSADTDYGITLKGITSVETSAIRNHEIMPYRNGSAGFMSQDEIDRGDMICFLPASVYADWHSFNSETDPAVFTVSTAVEDESGNIQKYREWNLQVAGTYILSGGKGWIDNEDGISELPVYMPLATLEKIRDEAVAFQNEYNPEWMNQITFNDQLDFVHPVTFEMKDLNATKELLRRIKKSEAFRSGEIRLDSSLLESEPVYTSVYSVTSSFVYLTGIIAIMTMIFVGVSTCISCMKNRRELTLLQSLGEKKKKLMIQQGTETYVLMILSALIAAPVSLYGVRKFAVWLFDSSIAERNSLIAETLRHSFSLNEVRITAEQMNQMLKWNTQCVSVLVVYVVMVAVVSLSVTRRMVNSAHPRDVLSGEEN